MEVSSTTAGDEKIQVIQTHQFDCPVTAIEFDRRRELLHVGLYTGAISLFTLPDFKLITTLQAYQLSSPVTSLSSCNDGTTKNLILAAYANGTAALWHSSSKRRLIEVQLEEQLYASALSSQWLAGAGYSGLIHASAVDKKQFFALPQEYKNRVYKLHFDDKNPNILYSGGWDSVLICWDIRLKAKLWWVYGPTVVGNSLDTQEGLLLAGSDSFNNKITIFKQTDGQLMETIDWIDTQKKARVKNCRFGVEGTIFATVTGRPEVRMYSRKGHLEGVWESEVGIKQLGTDKQRRQLAISNQRNELLVLKYR